MSAEASNPPPRGHTQSVAKISRPQLTQIYPRERLFEKLDAGRIRPMIWIAGPAGSGKTALGSSYIESRGLHCLWYQVDECDEDIATFFHYLSVATRQAEQGKAQPLPHFSAEYARGIPTFSRNFFAHLFEQLPAPAMLVLDNYQEVSERCGLHEVIRAGLEALPNGCSITVLSRHEPPPAFARNRANGAMASIGWRDLQASSDEIRGIWRLRTEIAPKHLLNLDAMANRMQGWIAGLVLLLEWTKVETVEPEALGEFVPETIFDYFAGELFEKTKPEVQAFLLRSALLPKMSEEMTRAFTSNDCAADILARLNRKNFFITRHTNARRIYQYHPLFRHFLLARGEQAFPQDELLRLKREAAHHLEQGGQLEAAIQLLADCRDWPRIALLVKANAQTLLNQGRGRTLLGWINDLPEDIRGNDPWLLYWLGTCLIGLDCRNSLPCFEQAFAAFRQTKDAAGVYLSWCGALEAIRYDWSASTQRWDRWLEVFDELPKEFPHYPSPDIELKVALWFERLMTWRMPDKARLDRWRRRMLLLAEASGDLSIKVSSHAHILLNQMTRGECAEAAVTVEGLERLLACGQPSPFAHTEALSWIAFYYLGKGRFRRCSECASEGLAVSRETGSHHNDQFLMLLRGAAALHLGDLQKCTDMLDRMAIAPDSRGGLGGHLYHQLAAQEALFRQDHPSARHHAEACLKIAENSGYPRFTSWGKLMLAAVCLEYGDNAGARRFTNEAMDIASTVGARWAEWMGHCLMSYSCFADSQYPAALGHLRDAFGAGRERGYRAVPTVLRASVVTTLCQEALKAGIETEYACDLIRIYRLRPDIPPLDVERWPWPLKIYTLGRFTIVRGGKVLEFTRKAPKKPLQLIKILIALGGRDVNEEQLIDALWPDKDGDTGHRTFVTTLQRARALIGDDSLCVSEGRISLSHRHCWVDTWAFDYMLERARAATSNGRSEEWLRLSELAFDLYQGHFLAGEPSAPWSGSLRNRLRTRFVRLVSDLGLYREQRGAWGRALECYQQGMHIDDLAEGFYQGEIRSLAQLGFKADALNSYHRCKRHLSICLDTEPSAATERVYRAALRG